MYIQRELHIYIHKIIFNNKIFTDASETLKSESFSPWKFQLIQYHDYNYRSLYKYQ